MENENFYDKVQKAQKGAKKLEEIVQMLSRNIVF